ncbi:Ferredoxin reductase [hydrothermal vent metagenome]|uniref:Ferredoxin reductase n=1 Tax=hydrothermal vent metagenome TaxID=652676 RepID=A0A3B0R614_9ZZZZ
MASSVTGLDRVKQQIQLADKTKHKYSHLILATGARPRQLSCPGASLGNIMALRSLADADRLRAGLATKKNLVIIGGGYVGLECAATAIKQGLNVTLLEAEERLLARVTGPQLAGFFADIHQKAGVDIRLASKASGFVGDKDVQGVVLETGEVLPADLVLVGIGVVPNQELAKKAGIDCDNGIIVDDLCRSSDERVFAIGDVSYHPNAIYQSNWRLESVHNAIEQGKTAALCIAGKAKPYAQVPWFWSDQYDLKLQMAGINTGYDQVIIRGEMTSGSFAVFYLKDRVLLACDAVNSPAEYMGSRLLIGKQAMPDPASLADISIAMKELMNNACGNKTTANPIGD